MISDKKNKKLIGDLIFGALFIGVLVFLIWKCKFGFGTADEAFYLTIPYRLTQGDSLFVNEWHISQMSAFLVYPFVKIYMLLIGNTEGIVLAFRYIYIAILSLISIFIYCRFRKNTQLGAAAAALCFLLYTPFGISALSYNSMGIICLTLAGVILATSERLKKLQHIFAGFFLAGAVLCSPYLLLVYVIFTLAVFACAIYRRAKKKPLNLSGVYNVRTWLFITIGAAIMAVLFAAFVLSRAGLSDIITAFPNVVSDSEHQRAGILAGLKGYVKAILFANRFSVYIYVVIAVTFLAAVIDKARRKHRAFFLIIAAVEVAALLISSMGYSRYINFVMFPLNIMAVFCVLVVDDFTIRKIFRTVWAAGMLYTLCIHFSSNQAYHTISSSSTVALVGTLVIIGLSAKTVLKQEKEKKIWIKLVAAASICLLCLQLGCQVFMRYTSVFDYGFDGEPETMRMLTCKITEGPNKGIYTKQAHFEYYNEFIEATRNLKTEYPAGTRLLVRSERTYAYLWLSDYKCGAYSSWLCDGLRTKEGLERSVEYYKAYPEMIPNIIYLETGEQEGEEVLLQFGDYQETQLSNGGRLWAK